MSSAATVPSPGLRALVDRPGLRYFVLGLAEKGIRFLLLLWVARTEGPSGMSAWNLYSLALTFAAIAQLAQVNGLRRELPLLADDHATVQKKEEMVGAALLGGVIVPVLLCLLAALTGPTIALAVSVALVGQTVFQLSNAVLVSSLRFADAARQQAISIGLLLVLSVVLGSSFGIAGYAWALGLSGAGAGILAARALRLPRATNPAVLSMMRGIALAGFWPMLVGVVFAIPVGVDRVLVASRLGADALGLYTLALQIGTILLWLRAGVAEQAYPRIARAIAAGEPPHAVRVLRDRQLLSSLLAVGVAVGCFALVGWPLVTRFLPAFTPGLSAALAMCAVGLAGIPSQVAGSIFHARRKSREYLIWQSGIALCTTAAIWIALVRIPRLWAAPVASAVVALVFGGLIHLRSERLLALGGGR